MSVEELPCKDLQDQLEELEDRIEVLQDLLEDPELTPAQKGAIRRQIRDTRRQVLLVEARLDECLSGPLLIAGVERTQATQFFLINGQGSGEAPDNSVPLVSLRPLIVRVYVNRKVTSGPGPLPPPPSLPVSVNGRLRYERTGPSPTQFPVLKPLNGPIVARPIGAVDRGEPHHTLNFRLPPVHCQGTLRLTVEVFVQPPVVEGSVAAFTAQAVPSDSVTVTARFEPVPAFRVRAVLIHYTGLGLDIAAPSGLDFARTLEYVLSTYPIARLEFGDCVEQEFDGDLTLPGPGCGPGWGALLDLLGDIRAGGDPDDIYVALLPRGVPTGTVGGCGGSGGLAATYVDSGAALAQEIGHGLRRMHAPCGDPPNVDPNYPTYGSYPSGSIGEFGFDMSSSGVFDPATSEDFMSYCGPRWVSPYTYVGLRNAMVERFAAMASAPAEGRASAQEMLYLKFRMYRDGSVELRPSFHRTGRPGPPSGPPSRVTCELVGAGGEVLVWHRCSVRDPHQELDGPALDFYEVLPWAPDAESIVFRRDGEVVATVDVEPETPTVEAAESTLAGPAGEVRWSAQHPDRPLAYLVDFTNDNGKTWRTVASGRDASDCHVNLRLLPGGEQCRFRVLASSGVRTAAAETSPFTVPVKPRRAYILSPQPGHVVTSPEPVTFRGGGFAPGQGLSEPEDAIWTSSIDGLLGDGYEVVASGLTAGLHTVTLTVPDGMGSVASADVTVMVGAPA